MNPGHDSVGSSPVCRWDPLPSCHQESETLLPAPSTQVEVLAASAGSFEVAPHLTKRLQLWRWVVYPDIAEAALPNVAHNNLRHEVARMNVSSMVYVGHL